MKHQKKYTTAEKLIGITVGFMIVFSGVMSASLSFADDDPNTENLPIEETEMIEEGSAVESDEEAAPEESLGEEQIEIEGTETEDEAEVISSEEELIMPLSVGSVYGGYTVTHTIDGSFPNDYIINTSGGVYEITGNSAYAIVVNNANCVLVLNNATRTSGASRLQLLGNSNVTLYLVGGTVNAFNSKSGNDSTGSINQAGIYVSKGTTLTIKGPGTLNAYGGVHNAGIGGNTSLINTDKNNGTLPSGTVIIEDGVINAEGGLYGAGIGGGFYGGNGTIVVKGGTVTANGGTCSAGIGGGGEGATGNITIEYGTVKATGGTNGAGLGSGHEATDGGNITIKGGVVEADSGLGAGIGGGNDSPCGNITISGGKVKAKGGATSAGIGGGMSFPGGNITISGGEVTAEGGSYSAGIGGGRFGSGGTIIIEAGTVKSLGGTFGGAGIGGGESGDGGTITINGGNVTAEGGRGNSNDKTDGAAGIGGGRSGKGGTIRINGGTVFASGTSGSTSPTNISGSGAGIGGGGGQVGGVCTGGNIYITGGDITARAYGSSAGIGGGYNSAGEYIEISGGKVDAQTKNAGAGIGAGGGSSCGSIEISGGEILARGAYMAAGIGSGQGSYATGTIKITGGVIDARSADNSSSGVGGGSGSTVDVCITGGSVFSANPQNNIRVNFNPHNCIEYGKKLVYLCTVKLLDEGNNVKPHTSISIDVDESTPGNALYTYHAETNADGIAYMWLPVGEYDYVLYDPDTGKYTDGRIEIKKPANDTYDPMHNYGEKTLPSTDPYWELSATSSPDTKIYGNATFTLTVNHTNTGPLKAIAGVKWFRESADNIARFHDDFDNGFNAADPSDRGIGGVGADLDLIDVFSPDHHVYQMAADKNGRYWVQIHYKGANTGNDIYHAAYLDFSNIYTPAGIYVRDFNASELKTVKQHTLIEQTGAAPYGIPFDFDGSVLNNPPLGYDEIIYERNDTLPSTHWSIAVPSDPGPFKPVIGNAESTKIILDKRFADGLEADATQDTEPMNKYYTVGYIRNANWGEVTVTNTISGDYANINKTFTFKARFTDGNNDAWSFLEGIDFIGGVIDGSGAVAPSGGTMTPNSSGEVEFTLKHGQTVTFLNVPADGYVRIIEDNDHAYEIYFYDSIDGAKTNQYDTQDQSMSSGEQRTYDFWNVMDYVVDSGVRMNEALKFVSETLPLIVLSACIVTLVSIQVKRVKR